MLRPIDLNPQSGSGMKVTGVVVSRPEDVVECQEPWSIETIPLSTQNGTLPAAGHPPAQLHGWVYQSHPGYCLGSDQGVVTLGS